MEDLTGSRFGLDSPASKSAIELRPGEDRPYLLLGEWMVQHERKREFFMYMEQQALAGDAVARFVHDNFSSLKNEEGVEVNSWIE